MNALSRTITGIAMIVLGVFLISIPFIWSFEEAGWVSWIYGIPLFVIGLFILFNKDEDKIEEVKVKGGKK